jgi:sarcosine oxidase subunit beta
VAERMAAWMCGEPDELFTRWDLTRFSSGQLEPEEMIIG